MATVHHLLYSGNVNPCRELSAEEENTVLEMLTRIHESCGAPIPKINGGASVDWSTSNELHPAAIVAKSGVIRVYRTNESLPEYFRDTENIETFLCSLFNTD